MTKRTENAFDGYSLDQLAAVVATMYRLDGVVDFRTVGETLMAAFDRARELGPDAPVQLHDLANAINTQD